MPQMTLTAEEAKMVRAHRKAMEARRWFKAGLEAAHARLMALAYQESMGTTARNVYTFGAEAVRGLEPPRDLGGD